MISSDELEQKVLEHVSRVACVQPSQSQDVVFASIQVEKNMRLESQG